jgi:hypothetical protein
LQALDVAACAGISVPVPGAPDPASSLVNPSLEPKTAQAVQHIKPRKPRADYYGIEGSSFRLARFGSADGSHVAFLPLKSLLVPFLWTRSRQH